MDKYIEHNGGDLTYFLNCAFEMQNGGLPCGGGFLLLSFSFTFSLVALVAYTLIKTPDTIRRRKEP